MYLSTHILRICYTGYIKIKLYFCRVVGHFYEIFYEMNFSIFMELNEFNEKDKPHGLSYDTLSFFILPCSQSVMMKPFISLKKIFNT